VRSLRLPRSTAALRHRCLRVTVLCPCSWPRRDCQPECSDRDRDQPPAARRAGPLWDHDGRGGARPPAPHRTAQEPELPGADSEAPVCRCRSVCDCGGRGCSSGCHCGVSESGLIGGRGRGRGGGSGVCATGCGRSGVGVDVRSEGPAASVLAHILFLKSVPCSQVQVQVRSGRVGSESAILPPGLLVPSCLGPGLMCSPSLHYQELGGSWHHAKCTPKLERARAPQWGGVRLGPGPSGQPPGKRG
jgi:hypothetical protein